jgi:hypothetical protein
MIHTVQELALAAFELILFPRREEPLKRKKNDNGK